MRVGILGFNAEEVLRRADERLANGEYFEALQDYRKVAERQGADLMLQSQAQFGVGRARQSLFEKLHKDAKQQFADGDKEAAVESCRSALEYADNDRQAEGVRGLLQEIDPPPSWQEESRGALTGTAGREAEWTSFRELGGEGVTAFDPLPDAPSETMSEEELFELYLAIFEPEVAETYRSFGPEFRGCYIQLQQGDMEGALEGLRKTPPEVASHPVFRLEIAKALGGTGSDQESLEILDALDPESLPEELREPRLDVMWMVCDRLDLRDRATELAKILYEQNPEDDERLRLYAEALRESGNREGAIELLLAASTRDVPDPFAMGMIVDLYEELRRRDDSIAMLERMYWKFFHDSYYLSQLYANHPSFLGIQPGEIAPEDDEKVAELVETMCLYNPISAEIYREKLAEYLEEPES